MNFFGDFDGIFQLFSDIAYLNPKLKMEFLKRNFHFQVSVTQKYFITPISSFNPENRAMSCLKKNCKFSKSLYGYHVHFTLVHEKGLTYIRKTLEHFNWKDVCICSIELSSRLKYVSKNYLWCFLCARTHHRFFVDLCQSKHFLSHTTPFLPRPIGG